MQNFQLFGLLILQEKSQKFLQEATTVTFVPKILMCRRKLNLVNVLNFLLIEGRQDRPVDEDKELVLGRHESFTQKYCGFCTTIMHHRIEHQLRPNLKPYMQRELS